jgi:methylated-DNA-[protein]-cysteine S-methyltransferase
MFYPSLTFETQLGWIAFTQREGKLSSLVFGYATKVAADRALDRSLSLGNEELSFCLDSSATELAERLAEFAGGQAVEFADVPIDVAHLTAFGRRVVAACRRIPWGQTRSYGHLARQAGSPGAARAVGQVMAHNRFPLIVPCHRVLAAGGRLGGFSSPQGTRMKARLLELESGALVTQ